MVERRIWRGMLGLEIDVEVIRTKERECVFYEGMTNHHMHIKITSKQRGINWQYIRLVPHHCSADEACICSIIRSFAIPCRIRFPF